MYKSPTKYRNVAFFSLFLCYALQIKILSINGTLGNIAYYNNEPIILGKSACYISLSKDISKEYVRVVLETKSFLDYAVHRATKTTIANISLNAIRTFLFPVPPLAEQKRIVEKIDEIFAKL